MKLRLPTILLALALPLTAQDYSPLATLFIIGEWHLGYSQVPADLKGVATDGTLRALGWSFPIPLAKSWQLRPRYDDGLFSGNEAWGAKTGVETRILQRHFGMDALYTLSGDRWGSRPTLYLGAGVGVMQTWHERTAHGDLQVPRLPASDSQETWSPAGRVCAGVQFTPWLALEAQVQASSHRFQGIDYADTFGTLGVRIWPAAMFGHRPRPQ